MNRHEKIRAVVLLLTGAVVLTGLELSIEAQSSAVPASGPQPVVIQRRPVQLSLPEKYRIASHLEPVRKTVLTAPFDGVVKSVEVKAGSKIDAQVRVAALDGDRAKLVLKRAHAAKALAEVELRQARIGGNAEQIALAQARMDVAEADVALAGFDVDGAGALAPYAGVVLAVHVADGQRVTAGSPLATIADISQLTCLLPVDRKAAAVGQTMTVTVEDANVTGTVQSLLPLEEAQQPLRDLAVSVAMATVVLDNRSGGLAPGQAVIPGLIPVDPIVRAPLDMVKPHAPSGGRFVAVIRAGTVKHVPVRLHGQTGTTDVFVSGVFLPDDEMIVASSVELPDATSVRPAPLERFAVFAPAAAATPGSATPAAGAGKPGTPAVPGAPARKKADAAGF